MKLDSKNINTGLLFLVVFLLILLAGFNIYYQGIISDISKEANEKEVKLVEITGKLALEETKAMKVSRLKEITETDKEFLEEDYHKLTDENELLKTEKNILEEKLDNDSGIGSCKASGTAICPD